LPVSLSFRSPSPLRQRLRPLGWLAAAYLLIGAATRIALLVMTGSGVSPNPLNYLYAFGVGAVSDLLTFVYVAWPLVLFLWIVPTDRPAVRSPGRWLAWIGALLAGFALCWGVVHLIWKASLHEVWPLAIVVIYLLPLPALAYNRRSGRGYLYGLCLALLFGLLFVAASELVFWQEFGVRFNFIAVDYLVYTTEVIGNIRESYPIGTWLALLAAVAVIVLWATRRRVHQRDAGTRFAQRSALAAVWLRGLSNDVYFQIGLVTLLGLAAKNAILIVEFASLRYHEGLSASAAAVEAARLRFRPILMTSLAFIFGVLPLAVSTGAGAGARHSVGTGVVGGMLAATFLAIFFVPMFFKLFSDRHLTERRSTAQIKDEALQARLLALKTAEVPHHAPHGGGGNA